MCITPDKEHVCVTLIVWLCCTILNDSGRVTCPECREVHQVPLGGFRNNVTIQRLLNNVRNPQAGRNQSTDNNGINILICSLWCRQKLTTAWKLEFRMKTYNFICSWLFWYKFGITNTFGINITFTCLKQFKHNSKYITLSKCDQLTYGILKYWPIRKEIQYRKDKWRAQHQYVTYFMYQILTRHLDRLKDFDLEL